MVVRLNEPKLGTLARRHFGLLRPRHRESIELLPAWGGSRPGRRHATVPRVLDARAWFLGRGQRRPESRPLGMGVVLREDHRCREPRDLTTLSDGEHGLGIDRSSDFPSELAYGHSGSQPGYAALLAIFPERQIVVVMFVNDEKADVNGHAGQSSAHSASDIRAGAREEAPILPYRRVGPRSGRA